MAHSYFKNVFLFKSYLRFAFQIFDHKFYLKSTSIHITIHSENHLFALDVFILSVSQPNLTKIYCYNTSFVISPNTINGWALRVKNIFCDSIVTKNLTPKSYAEIRFIVPESDILCSRFNSCEARNLIWCFEKRAQRHPSQLASQPSSNNLMITCALPKSQSKTNMKNRRDAPVSSYCIVLNTLKLFYVFSSKGWIQFSSIEFCLYTVFFLGE